MPFLLGTGPGMHYKSLLKRKVNSGNLISVKKQVTTSYVSLTFVHF